MTVIPGPRTTDTVPSLYPSSKLPHHFRLPTYKIFSQRYRQTQHASTDNAPVWDISNDSVLVSMAMYDPYFHEIASKFPSFTIPQLEHVLPQARMRILEQQRQRRPASESDTRNNHSLASGRSTQPARSLDGSDFEGSDFMQPSLTTRTSTSNNTNLSGDSKSTNPIRPAITPRSGDHGNTVGMESTPSTRTVLPPSDESKSFEGILEMYEDGKRIRESPGIPDDQAPVWLGK